MALKRNDVVKTLASIRQAHATEFGLIRIGIFGSAARDQLADDSDVDLVVELAQPDLLLLVGIKLELEALIGRPVDIVRYRSDMNLYLKRKIEQEAVYV